MHAVGSAAVAGADSAAAERGSVVCRSTVCKRLGMNKYVK